MSKTLASCMAPYIDERDSLLDLCCGVCNVTVYLKTASIDCVDVYSKYIEHLSKRNHFKDRKHSYIESDAIEFLNSAIRNNRTWDIVTCIDGVEHFPWEKSQELMAKMIEVSRKHVMVYTPDGYTLTTPHNTWGIEGGDEYQIHHCGIDSSWFIENGWKIIHSRNRINEFDKKPYTANCYLYSIR